MGKLADLTADIHAPGLARPGRRLRAAGTVR